MLVVYCDKFIRSFIRMLNQNRPANFRLTHHFFKNEQWTFNSIRHSVPPIVHDLSGDDDTRNFDDVENDTPSENFPTPKAFAVNHLPFIGFTYSKDYQLLAGGDKPPPIPDRVSCSAMVL